MEMKTETVKTGKKWYQEWWGKFFIISVSVLFLVILYLIISQNMYASDYDAFKKIFGVYSGGGSSGLVAYDTNTPGVTKVSYHLYPIDKSNLDEEIGMRLSRGIQKVYGKRPNVDQVEFYIFLPFSDDYGNQDWKVYISFTTDRDLVGKINWDNFYGQDLLKVVKDKQQYIK